MERRLIGARFGFAIVVFTLFNCIASRAGASSGSKRSRRAAYRVARWPSFASLTWPGRDSPVKWLGWFDAATFQYVANRVTDSVDSLGRIVGNHDVKLLFKFHDEFNSIEGIGNEVGQ